MLVTLKNGVNLRGSQTIKLDPTVAEGHFFVSHAHSDHMPRRGSGHLIASDETKEIMRFKNLEFPNSDLPVELSDAGHMVGSRMLKFEDALYTGDMNTEDRLFLRGAKPQKCDTLIMENTFGSAEFEFPKFAAIRESVRAWLEENPKTVWFGYTFGKSQMLTALANDLGFTPICQSDVYNANKLVSKFTDLGPFVPFGGASADEMSDGQHIVIAPASLSRSIFTSRLRADGYKTAVFTGWALSGDAVPRYGTDTAFPLSDHADFSGLVKFAEKCNPKKVFLVYGENEDLVRALKHRGLDASILRQEVSLFNFLR